MVIYKVLRPGQWRDARARGVLEGTPDDIRDGFIHFSTAAQVRATLARHYATAREVVLLEVPAAALGPALRWEPARDGALFPHLYGALSLTAVRRSITLGCNAQGAHDLPPEFP